KPFLHNSKTLQGSPRSSPARPAPCLIPTSRRPLSHRFPPSILPPPLSTASTSASVPTHSNFNTSPRASFNLHTHRVRRATAFLPTAFSNARTPYLCSAPHY